MDAIEQLQKRARLAVLAGVDALTAMGHLEHALINAKHGAVDRAVVFDLEQAKAAIERAVTHAERCRRRLLRKADLLEVARG
jgi:hypothetical protein